MRTATVVMLSMTVLLSFTACDDGVITPPPPPPPYDIIAIIEYIEDSFLERDVNGLEILLTDDFVFHFNPEDVGEEAGGYVIPESWTNVDFTDAVGTMFDMAYSIDISIDTSVIDDPIIDDNAYTASEVPVSLLVMTDPVNGYIAQGTFTFEFAAEYNQNYEKYWYVTVWRDYTSPGVSGGRGIVPSSFGEILARFHKP